MTKSLIQSNMYENGPGISDGQIKKLMEKLGADLRKHRGGLNIPGGISFEIIQDILSHQDSSRKVTEAIVDYLERMSNELNSMFMVEVSVDRHMTPNEIWDLTGRRIDHLPDNVKIPRWGSGVQKVKVVFFTFGRDVAAQEVQARYDSLGLVADVYAQAIANSQYPKFSAEHFNASVWKNKSGQWCTAVFRTVGGEPYAGTNMNDRLTGGWWYCGRMVEPFPVWTTIKVGGLTLAELREKIRLSEYSDFGIKSRSLKILPTAQKIELVKIKLIDLGIEQARHWEIYEMISNHVELAPCPIETPFQLGLVRKKWDTQTDHRFEVVTKPFVNGNGDKMSCSMERLMGGKPKIQFYPWNVGLCFGGHEIVVAKRSSL